MHSPEILPFSDVYEAYMDCRRHKRNTHNALEFELNLEENLVRLWKDLLYGTYAIGRSIAFIVTKPRIREIFAADFRDRIVHHLVIRRLEPLFESHFIDDNYNCRKNKGALYGIKRLSERIDTIMRMPDNKDIFIAKFDMENFFMHIHRPTLWSKLEKFIQEEYHEADKALILALTRIIVLHSPENNCIRRSPMHMWNKLPASKSLFQSDYEWGLPIGNLSSQVFANFLLHDFDTKFLNNGYAGRYVDDFYLIGNKQELLANILQMKKELQKTGITLHRKKFYMQHFSKGVAFLGTICKPGRIYVKNSTLQNAMRMILQYNNSTNKSDLAEEFMTRLNCYLGYMSHCSSYAVRYSLMLKVNAEWREFLFFTNELKKVALRKKQKPKNILIQKLRKERKTQKHISISHTLTGI